MDRDMAAGFTMLFSILLIPLGLVVWAATVLISVATLIWGANRLRLRTLIWYLCLTITSVMYGLEQGRAAFLACLGLATLVFLPIAWLFLPRRGHVSLGA